MLDKIDKNDNYIRNPNTNRYQSSAKKRNLLKNMGGRSQYL